MLGSDDDLVTAACAGDVGALDTLLRRHHDRVWALCRRMMGNDVDAADATQEALIAIVKGLPSFDRRSALSTWMYRVTANACLDELRRRARRPVLVDGDRTLGEPTGHRPAEHRVTDRVTRGVEDAVVDRVDLDSALATLSPEFRAAVVLRDLCELDYAEIAAVLGIPAGTVRSRIARGRAALAGALGNHNGEQRRPTPST